MYVYALISIEDLYEHDIGHSKFTSLGLPWQLIYSEEFETLELARKRNWK